MVQNGADNLTEIRVNTDKGTGKGGVNGHDWQVARGKVSKLAGSLRLQPHYGPFSPLTGVVMVYSLLLIERLVLANGSGGEPKGGLIFSGVSLIVDKFAVHALLKARR